jgi:hypothetical protein
MSTELIKLSELELHEPQAPSLRVCAAIALRRLGLLPKGETIWHPLGRTLLAGMPDVVIDAIVEKYLEHVNEEIEEAEAEIPPPRYYKPDQDAYDRFVQFAQEMLVLDYEYYLYVVKNRRNFTPTRHETRYFLENYSFRHTPDRKGWRTYLEGVSPMFGHILNSKVPVIIPETERLAHTYLVAASGAGKSELLKKFIHSYYAHPTYCSVMVIDPAGDFAQEIAHWQENIDNERFIYVAPDLDLGMTPTINPFEIADISASDASPPALAVKKVVAQQLLEGLEEVISEGEGGELSKNMKTILLPCILTLLDKEGATLRDLQRFMNDEKNRDLVEFGRTRRHYPETRDFFLDSFLPPKDKTRSTGYTFGATKTAIRTKMQDLFSTGTFADLTCGKSTINLETAWDQRKIVIFNLSSGKIGGHEARAFGRLIVAMLQGIAMRHADLREIDRIPCHLFIDEVQNFTTPSLRTIMDQARKYKLVLTCCQQVLGGGMDVETRKSILASSNIQIAGATKPMFFSEVASLFRDVSAEDIATLRVGEFYIRLGQNNPSFRVAIDKDLLKDANAMTSGQWERVKREQLRRYYRPVGATPTAAPDPPAHAPRPITNTPTASPSDDAVI